MKKPWVSGDRFIFIGPHLWLIVWVQVGTVALSLSNKAPPEKAAAHVKQQAVEP